MSLPRPDCDWLFDITAPVFAWIGFALAAGCVLVLILTMLGVR